MAEAPEDIFKNACETFRSSLSEDDRRSFTEFPNARSMLRAIEEHAKSHPIHSSLLTKCCKKIHSLSTKLTPYFEIIGIFVQAHPEFAALAWGSIRLVFQLGSNHVVFLERICNMFENMAALLPAYEEYVKKMRARAERQGNRVSDRLLSAMAYIYSDLIQFCFDAYKLLSKKKSRIMRLKGSFVHSLNWQPFDVRYDVLLRRWKMHQELMDLEMRVSSQVQQIESAGKLEEMLRTIEQRWGAQNEATEKLEREEMEHRLQLLKEWIHPPTWFGLFENALNMRTANTTDWFLADPVVRRWLLQIEDDSDGCRSSLMTVQGKPGYGKTTLCTTLIENLQKRSGFDYRNNDISGFHPSDLGFFYFDKQRPEGVQSSGAFRAILTQLLQRYGNDKEVIDIVTVIWNETQVGQLYATDREVLCALHLLIQRCGQVILVFDGIDECIDQDTFFERLRELSQISNSFTVGLFSRPTIKIPRSLAKDTLCLDLGNSQNHRDICTYLRPKIVDLVEYGMLPESTDIEDTVEKISNRANGMFLWVTLLIQYLQSPSLSTRQVSEAISNLNRLQGLDSLYTAILRTLEHQASAQAKVNTARAFQLVAFSYRPLCVSELECAMVVPLDRRVDKDDIIPDFSQNLRCISGALMEICDDTRVRFIHLSVLEYLTDPTQSYFDIKSTNVASTAALAHHSCACFCLSYLYFTLPAEPLSGSAQTTADRDFQERRHPFLDYASEFWSSHLLHGIKAADLTSKDQEGDLTDPIVHLASRFLTSKAAVTAWIRASWTFLHPPHIDLSLLDEELSETVAAFDPAETGKADLLAQALQLLQRLSLDLQDLDSSWAEVLRANPNEIWEPSISAFIKSSFWVSVPGSNITRLALKEAGENSICLKSQVSSDGLRLGVARLCPNTRITSTPGNWKVYYEIWNIGTRNLVYQSDIEIPEPELGIFIDSATFTGELGKCSFQFPTALSADLTTIAIPGLIASISEGAESLDSGKHMTEKICTQLLNMSFSGMPTISTRPYFLQLNPEDFKKPYAVQISKSGETLLTLHRSSGLIELDSKHGSVLWLAIIYQDRNFRLSSVPDYCYVASIAFKPYNPQFHSEVTEHGASEDEAESIILLHPHLPMLGFKHRGCILRQVFAQRQGLYTSREFLNYHQDTGIGETALWDFSCRGPESLEFFRVDEQKLNFSDCGNYFCGIRHSPLKTRRRIPGHGSSDRSDGRRGWRDPWYPPRHKASTVMSYPRLHHRGEVAMTGPAIQDSSSLVRSTESTGQRSISQLHHTSSGAVVLQTLRDDELMISETLTQLPNWASKNCQVTLLRTCSAESRDSDAVHLVLNPAGRSFQLYEAQKDPTERNNKTLPMILERKRETIATSFGRGMYSLEGGIRFQGHTQKRLGSMDHGEVKRRRLLGPPRWQPSKRRDED